MRSPTLSPLPREPEDTVQIGGRITPEHRRMLERLFGALDARRPTLREVIENAIDLTAATAGPLARSIEGEGTVSIAARVTPVHGRALDAIQTRLSSDRKTTREALEVIIEAAYQAAFPDDARGGRDVT